MKAFDLALAFVFGEEGGYSNRAADPGGPTNYGIIQETYDNYRRSHGLPVPKSVREITREEAREIYLTQYWKVIKGEQLSKLSVHLAVAAMDWAVESSPHRAAIELQHLLGVSEDGTIGPQTLTAVAAKIDADSTGPLHGSAKLVEAYATMRAQFLGRWAKAHPGNPGVLHRVPDLLHYFETTPDLLTESDPLTE